MGDDVSSTNAGARGLPYVPGLDGVRGLPLVVIFAYHLEWSFVPGGVFSVSLFFTLSGYLITQLMVREFDSSGHVRLGTFWARRLRRLMPAALVTIAAVALVSITTPIFDGPRLRGDLLAALGYGANWRFAATGNSYEDLFTATASPIQHFWSLAIEEQFYFVFPLVMTALLLLGRRVGRQRTVVFGGVVALVVASLVAGALTSSRTLSYFGTHVRAVEILIGALLALVLPVGRDVAERWAGITAVVSTGALVLFFVLVATVETSDDIVYEGGLAAFSLVSCLLVLGAMVPGPVRSFMSWRPLVWVGKVSYGLYVYHWPVFMAVNEQRLGFDGLALDAVRLAITVMIAVLSFRFLEEPIRRRRSFAAPRHAGVAVVAAVAVVLAVVFVVARPTPVVLAGVDAPDQVVAFDAEADDPTAPVEVNSAPVPSRRVLVIGGDSSIASRVREHVGATVDVVDRSRPDCPLRLGGTELGGCPSVASILDDREEFDVLVIATGDLEREHVSALAGEETARRLLEFDGTLQRRFTVPLGYSLALQSLVGESATLIIDTIRGDELGNRLADLGAQRTTIAYVDSPTEEVWRSEFDLLVSRLDAADDRTGVVVIGDSVSYGVARALNDVARDRYEVVWAGGRNCPLVDVFRIRWWDGVEFDMTACPDLDGTWIPLWEEFEPEVLVVVVSVPEQADQMYEADGDWYVVGGDEFARRHDEAVDRLMGLAEAAGTRVVFFTSPTIHGGALGEATFGRPERVVAWNEEMAAYGERWPFIEFFDWAEIVERYESANGGEPGGLRGDGVHMGEEVLAEILTAELVPFLDAGPAVGSVP